MNIDRTEKNKTSYHADAFLGKAGYIAGKSPENAENPLTAGLSDGKIAEPHMAGFRKKAGFGPACT